MKVAIICAVPSVIHHRTTCQCSTHRYSDNLEFDNSADENGAIFFTAGGCYQPVGFIVEG